jgi:hypothetical protein
MSKIQSVLKSQVNLFCDRRKVSGSSPLIHWTWASVRYQTASVADKDRALPIVVSDAIECVALWILDDEIQSVASSFGSFVW